MITATSKTLRWWIAVAERLEQRPTSVWPLLRARAIDAQRELDRRQAVEDERDAARKAVEHRAWVARLGGVALAIVSACSSDADPSMSGSAGEDGGEPLSDFDATPCLESAECMVDMCAGLLAERYDAECGAVTSEICDATTAAFNECANACVVEAGDELADQTAQWEWITAIKAALACAAGDDAECGRRALACAAPECTSVDRGRCLEGDEDACAHLESCLDAM